MTADSSAETLVGATGCASGSQLLTGTSPALTAKPANDRMNTAQATPSVRWGETARQSPNCRLPEAMTMRMNAMVTAMVPASPSASITKPP